MSKAAAKFRKVDVTRAIAGAQAAGISVQRIEITPDGAIVLGAGAADAASVNPLDDWLRENGSCASD